MAFFASEPLYSINVRVCHACRAEMNRNRVLRRIVLVASMVIGCVLCLYCYVWYPDVMGRSLWKMIGVIIMLPGIIYYAYHADPVRLDIKNSTIGYVFSNSDVASKFAVLNQSFLEDSSGPPEVRSDDRLDAL